MSKVPRLVGAFSSGPSPVRIILFGVGSTVGPFWYLNNTKLLDIRKENLKLHRDDKPVEPSESLLNLVKQVSEETVEKNLASRYTKIEPVIVPGLNTFSYGTLGTLSGGIIGLPEFFEFTNKEDAKGKILEQGDGKQPAKGTDMEQLYDCFVLSDKAKRYAIAREILHINSYQVYVDMSVPLALTFVINKLSEDLTKQLANSKIFTRHFINTGLLVFGIAMWYLIHSTASNYFESDVEEDITKLGKDYVEGALEYYDKEVKRKSYPVVLTEQLPETTFASLIEFVKELYKPSSSTKSSYYKLYLQHLNKKEQSAT